MQRRDFHYTAPTVDLLNSNLRPKFKQGIITLLRTNQTKLESFRVFLDRVRMQIKLFDARAPNGQPNVTETCQNLLRHFIVPQTPLLC